eukprot:CAMPEP_0196137778 /NCGR_PEP_ID=MMETSP0910-20130528/5653_1 /TAXON_ID=49265 /ORGANISM="Thalassiosira rotula, Strain GSO102" /LENGTH=156 /DNA_ID=CAMNT_0041398285 /DNA_START=66 /DNA_END=536 /DNA_ORIENTATION=+
MVLIVDFPQRRPLPTKGKPPRVSFTSHAKVVYIENLSLNHKADLWFLSQEIERFKIQVARLLYSILSSGASIAQYAEVNARDTSTFMGLENYLTPNTSQNIRSRRRAILRAVLLEQARQLNAGVCDPDAMADIVWSASEKSRKRARVIGLLHASGF